MRGSLSFIGENWLVNVFCNFLPFSLWSLDNFSSYSWPFISLQFLPCCSWCFSDQELFIKSCQQMMQPCCNLTKREIQNTKYQVQNTKKERIPKSFSSKVANSMMQPCCNLTKREIQNTKYQVQNTKKERIPKSFSSKVANSMMQPCCNLTKREIQNTQYKI